jgi:hypothetical protein
MGKARDFVQPDGMTTHIRVGDGLFEVGVRQAESPEPVEGLSAAALGLTR